VWVRLRLAGARTSLRGVLRLMREDQLLAPQRQPQPVEPKRHEGTILAERPNQMWGIDAKAGFGVRDGQAPFLAMIDHCSACRLGIHVTRCGTRFEALELVRQAVREPFGGFAQGIALGVKLRHDHGSQFLSDDLQREIRFLDLESSPGFVRKPEGNGCIERFFRTLKEQLLWVRHFETLEELAEALEEFRQRYGEDRLIERLHFQSPRKLIRPCLPSSLLHDDNSRNCPRNRGRYNGRLRDACPNANWFANLAEAKERVEEWRKQCNSEEPNRTLKNVLFRDKAHAEPEGYGLIFVIDWNICATS
jgi:transposase InsO family protein